MKTSDFDFVLPEQLIARYPLKNRTESKLLYVSPEGKFQHKIFSDLPDLLTPKDVLIFNNTRVIPARLYAKKMTGGKVEILIERILDDNHAYAHVKANKSFKFPCMVELENGIKVIINNKDDEFFHLKFECKKTIYQVLNEIGRIPLPGYLQRQDEEIDKERYQTVYALQEGAIAAPTAGLHFDHALLESLRKKNIRFGFITLHVGAGTFKPVKVEKIADHKIHHELYEINAEVCELVNSCKASGGRVIAVGTTAVRALETAMQGNSILSPCSGETNIFIYPGYRFQAINGLITNFHLPKSTLLMLVCAFGGYEKVMEGYAAAIDAKYRFYSYGDAMFLAAKDDSFLNSPKLKSEE